MSENNLLCSECHSLLVNKNNQLICSVCGLIELSEQYDYSEESHQIIQPFFRKHDKISCLNTFDIFDREGINISLFLRMRKIDIISKSNDENINNDRVIKRYKRVFDTTSKTDEYIRNEMKIVKKRDTSLTPLECYLISYLNYNYLINNYIGLKVLFSKVNPITRTTLSHLNKIYHNSLMSKFIPNRFMRELNNAIIILNNNFDGITEINHKIIDECLKIKKVVDKTNYQTNTSFFAIFSIIQAFRNLFEKDISISKLTNTLNRTSNWFYKYKYDMRRLGVKI